MQNRSPFERTQEQASPYIFISIFYAQEKWHELLPVIHRVLRKNHQREDQPRQKLVFFSRHRGSSIRLLLNYEYAHQKENYLELLEPILGYIEQHPSILRPLRLPINTFFLDFPNNSVHYNLFSERSIAPGELSHFQVLLSHIMLQFFDDHPVDDEGVFTLTVWLQQAILNGLSDLEHDKQDLATDILSRLNAPEAGNDLELHQLEEVKPFEQLQPHTIPDHLENLFLQVELFTSLLKQRIKDPLDVYFLLLRIVREHLFTLPNDYFLQPFLYAIDAAQVENST